MTGQTASNWGTDAPASISPGTTIGPSLTATPAASYGGPGTGSLAPLPATPVATMSADQIMTLLHRLEPTAIEHAGAAHTSLGQTLTDLANQLSGHAQTLAENWSGQAADTSLASLQQTHSQTVAAAQGATAAGAVLTWLGKTVLPQFKALPDPRSGLLDAAGSVPTALGHLAEDLSGNPAVVPTANAASAADTTAQGYLTALNEYLVEANNNLPDPRTFGYTPAAPANSGPGTSERTGQGNEAISSYQGIPGTTRGAGGGGAIGTPSGGRTSSGGGTGTGSGGIYPGSPTPGSASGSGGSSALPGSLQSATAPSALPGAPASGTGGAGSVPGTEGIGSLPGAPLVPALDVPTGSSGIGGLPGTPGQEADLPDVPGLGSVGAGSYGGAADAASGGVAQDAAYGVTAAGADGGASETGLSGFPMAGAGAGNQSEKERQRYAWMDEDADIWGGPENCVPPVIEGTDWILRRDSRDRK